MSTLEGKSIFEWRNEYAELAASFCQYADHTDACYAAMGVHRHRMPVDDRVVCEAAPCTCGLLVILSVLNPTITYGVSCPDAPSPPRKVLRLAAITALGTKLYEYTDADTDASVPNATDNGY